MSQSTPSVPTIKRLFAVSGNLCAFPKCANPLVDRESGKVTGRICHIKARSEGGERYDGNQSGEERHSFDNLVLMCPIHHDVIDSDADSYSVERLLQIKHEHEAKFQDGAEPDNNLATSLIDNSQNTAIIASTQNQSGGQNANRIYNINQNSDEASRWEYETQMRRLAHDTAIFRQSDEIMSEEFLGNFVGTTYGTHTYRESQFEVLDAFNRFASQVKNQYINTQVNETFIQLNRDIDAMTTFLSNRFHDYPENQTNVDIRYRMQPDISPSVGFRHDEKSRNIYDRLTSELQVLLQRLRSSYVNYRKAVKEHLIT